MKARLNLKCTLFSYLVLKDTIKVSYNEGETFHRLSHIKN